MKYTATYLKDAVTVSLWAVRLARLGLAAGISDRIDGFAVGIDVAFDADVCFDEVTVLDAILDAIVASSTSSTIELDDVRVVYCFSGCFADVIGARVDVGSDSNDDA